MTAKNYEAILFDFDGVLVDSEPIHLECWMQVLAPFGIHVDWQTYCERYIGVDDRQMIRELCASQQPPVSYESAWAQYPNKKRLFEARMHDADVIQPAIRDMLERLHETTKIAVVTSSAQSEVEPILAAGGLLPHIDTAVYGGDVKRLKPAPDPYLLAAERLRVTRALVVEDSAAGLAAGRAAGFDVLHIARQCEVVEVLAGRLASDQ